MSLTNPRIRPSAAPPTSTLAVIRIALLVGVLMFGAVTYMVQRGDTWQAAGPDLLDTLRVALLATWVVAVVLLLVLRARLTRLTEVAGRSVLIIAWAVGEGAALFGGVYYFLSGNPEWFIIGLFVMLASFILFPIRRR
ncbi:MAG TPA: hypothetical protein VK922_11050 [Gemmatimonadaceae bacterium]|nr:hypothetical protein [Gemmatimonadaceae bacterium]